jgi:ABC-type uncharacterized transport system involved in gliding motility auxiliary subunit
MKKLTQILGLIGVVFAGVGFFALLIGRRLNLFIELHLLVGLGLALFGLITNLAGLKDYFLKQAGKTQSRETVQIILLFFGIFLLGAVVYQHNWLMDVTKNRLYTLSPRTVQMLKQIPGPIKVTAFLSTEGFERTRQGLKLFEKEAPEKLKIETIDPDRHPEQAEAKSISTYGTVIFEYQQREVRAVEPNEEEILNSLIRVTRAQSPVVYFITGHGEADPTVQDKGGMSMLKHYLEQENLQVKKIEMPTSGVPDDASLLVIAGPRAPFQNWEVQELDRWLGKGGDAVFLLDAFVFTNLEGLLENYGLGLGNGVVVDDVNYMVGMDVIGLSPVTSKFAVHEITQGMEGKRVTFPRVRPLAIINEQKAQGKWDPLVYSSANSFVETDLDQLIKFGKVQRTPDKPSGEQLLAAAYLEHIQYKAWEILQAKKSSQNRLVVVGNSHFMRNMALDVDANYILAMNIFNWASGESDFARLAPKKRSSSRIYLSERQTNIIFYSSVLIIPEILIIMGVAVWWRRK